jgi:hypothetical protein
MSELPEQTPPTPSSAAPKTPTKSAAPTGSLNQIFAKIQPIAQQAWVSSRPTIAQGLKATIGLLQSATDQIDRQIQTDKRPVKPLNLEPVKKAANTFWTKAQPIWAKLIRFIRSRLPAEVTGKLTDRALSGIVAGFALLLLSITTHLPSGNAAPKPVVIAAKPVAPVRSPVANPTPIAKQFPIDAAEGSQTPFPQALTAPGTAPVAPTALTPSIASSTTPTTTEGKGVGGSRPAVAERPLAPTPIDKPTTPTTPIDKPIDSTTKPTTPATPIVQSTDPTPMGGKGERPLAPTPINQPTTPIASATKPTTPAPVIKLTPNQKLLAKLQAATPDRPNLLQTVNPNKAQGRLQITLAPTWVDLPFTQQDTVAQDLFTKAQTLRFKTLELVNGNGAILARSPVVGSEMVVLLRN